MESGQMGSGPFVRVERVEGETIGLSRPMRAALDAWLERVGAVAFVDLETTGLPESRTAEILEIGIVLLDPPDPSDPPDPRSGPESGVRILRTLLRPGRPIPPLVSRLTGLVDADVAGAPRLSEVRTAVCEALAGRLLVAHQIEFERTFLRRDLDSSFGTAAWLDTQELLAFTHPDAPDLRLETFTRRLLGREERHRAVEDAADAACAVAAIAVGARAGEPRHREARRILETHLPSSPWLALLTPARPEPLTPDRFAALARGAHEARGAGPSRDARPAEPDERFLQIGTSDETPVPFELDAILEALADGARGERHFPGYRVRQEQLELAREFFTLLRDGGIAKLEGGTGVGKSLAYLSAAIPFAMQRARDDERGPIVISTRTKLLQDQLLRKDIAAAARFLGHPELQALSIKGRANYVCERRLEALLAEARDPTLLADGRADYAMLEACARIRPQGEVGTVPSALMRRHPRLRELLRASVALRAEHCSREQCAQQRSCPFGRHRRALAKAHLVVANHDLLLRWPPDYPAFSHAIMDEGHEVGGVAEEVYALRVRPEEIGERLDELFGAPVRRGSRRYASQGLVQPPDSKSEEATRRQNRRDLMLELIGLGRAMAAGADGFGGVELGAEAAARLPLAAELSASAARRLDGLANEALRSGPLRRGPEAEAADDLERGIAAHVEALRAAALGLRSAFEPTNDDYVSAFEGLESPYDRWSLVLRPVAPGEAFRSEFLERLDSLAIVSATLFVSGDAQAALGEIGLGDDSRAESWSRAVGSPFPYDRAMRIVAIRGEAELVEETAQALAILARTLGGRTLGLFTSLARMRAAADRLTQLLAGEGIEVLLPRRAGDDAGALVERFQQARGGAVLLGARRFWQGIDVRGEDLQAVVIEKLPFDVPTELRRRRDERLRAAGEDPFVRSSLGRMLLHLKQMAGRLIRSETDRGLVVIVDARRDRGYFRRLPAAFPEGVKIEVAPRSDLPRIARELGLGLDSAPDPGATGQPGSGGTEIRALSHPDQAE
jgi:ATP-dependent DNA helicase DinG